MANENHQAHVFHTPALRLIPEILAIIFSFHADANPTNPSGDEVVPRGMTVSQVRLGWITVTHVCSLWRQVALDHRTLWTQHRFNLGPEWSTEILRRAGDTPLTLTFSQGIVPFLPSKVDAADLISQLLPRVSSLTIGDGACTPTVLESLTLPAPLISSLSISSGHFAVLPRQLFKDIAPRLRHLLLCNALPARSTVALTRLKSLSISIDRHIDTSNIPSYADLFHTLQAMPYLESLILTGCLPLDPFPPCLEEQQVRFPKLRHLHLNGNVQGFRQLLEHLDFPQETIVWGTCLTDDVTGKECCDILPLLLSYLPRPSLETLDVSWGDRYGRTFHIRGYSTSHEEISGKPRFSLKDSRCFSINFEFKFLLWSTEQKLRILKTVYSALPTEELRILSGNLDLGKEAWAEIFGGHQELRHIRICSLSTLQSLILFLGRGQVYPKLMSLTLRNMDLNGKQVGATALIKELQTGRPPTLSKIFVETCRISRNLVDSMKVAVPDIEIEWDGTELPGWFQATHDQRVIRRAPKMTPSRVGHNGFFQTN